MKTNWLIVIVGPTAVGKSRVAVKLANLTDIILSADSRQVFQEIPIGTAQVDRQEQNNIPHFFMGNFSLYEAPSLNAGQFQEQAEAILQAHYCNNKRAFLVGGSGLYVNALCFGLNEFPDVAPSFRERAISLYQERGLQGLQTELQQLDPVYFERVDLQNAQRLMRALEVCWSTNRPFSSFWEPNVSPPSLFRPLFVGIVLPKEQLMQNIERRTKNMLADGLIEEAKAVQALRDCNALKTVGYPEVFDYLDGKISLDTARDLINLHTRQYAKRQMTWFKKNSNIQWFSPEDIEGIREYIARKTSSE